MFKLIYIKTERLSIMNIQAQLSEDKKSIEFSGVTYEKRPVRRFFSGKFFGKEVTYSKCNKALHYKWKITDIYVFGVSVYHKEETVHC